MALQPGALPNVPSLPYWIQIGDDKPLEGVASLQSCNDDTVKFQVDGECFEMPPAIFEHLPREQIVIGWIPDEHRSKEQKDQLQEFSAVANGKDGLQNAATEAMELYNDKFKDTLKLQARDHSIFHYEHFSEYLKAHAKAVGSVLLVFVVLFGFNRTFDEAEKSHRD
ncbi:MAG: hypothetical protein Q9164_006231 [Protoblastenia rupestris]